MANETIVIEQFVYFRTVRGFLLGQIIKKELYWFGTEYTMKYITSVGTIQTAVVVASEIQPVIFDELPEQERMRWMLGVMRG